MSSGATAAVVNSAFAPVVAKNHVTTTKYVVQGTVFGFAGGLQYSPSGSQTLFNLDKLLDKVI
jgi:hypothetical protein